MELFWIRITSSILELSWFLVQQFGSCKTFFFFERAFFAFLYANEHRRGGEPRCCLSAGRLAVDHLNARLGPAACRLIQEQKRGQGRRSEGNRKQFRPAAVHMTVSWRVVSRERQSFAEIKKWQVQGTCILSDLSF